MNTVQRTKYRLARSVDQICFCQVATQLQYMQLSSYMTAMSTKYDPISGQSGPKFSDEGTLVATDQPRTDADMFQLRRLNLVAGFLHLASLIAVLALSNTFTLPVTSTYSLERPGTGFTEPVVLFDIRGGLRDRSVPRLVGGVPLPRRVAHVLPALHRFTEGRPQYLPLGRVLPQLVDHDHPHRPALRDRRVPHSSPFSG